MEQVTEEPVRVSRVLGECQAASAAEAAAENKDFIAAWQRFPTLETTPVRRSFRTRMLGLKHLAQLLPFRHTALQLGSCGA